MLGKYLPRPMLIWSTKMSLWKFYCDSGGNQDFRRKKGLKECIYISRGCPLTSIQPRRRIHALDIRNAGSIIYFWIIFMDNYFSVEGSLSAMNCRNGLSMVILRMHVRITAGISFVGWTSTYNSPKQEECEVNNVSLRVLVFFAGSHSPFAPGPGSFPCQMDQTVQPIL